MKILQVITLKQQTQKIGANRTYTVCMGGGGELTLLIETMGSGEPLSPAEMLQSVHG